MLHSITPVKSQQILSFKDKILNIVILGLRHISTRMSTWGRTLQPLTIIIFFLGIGWLKTVQINAFGIASEMERSFQKYLEHGPYNNQHLGSTWNYAWQITNCLAVPCGCCYIHKSKAVLVWKLHAQGNSLQWKYGPICSRKVTSR